MSNSGDSILRCRYHTSSISCFICSFLVLDEYYFTYFIGSGVWRWCWNSTSYQTIITLSKPLIFMLPAKSFPLLTFLSSDFITFLGFIQVCSTLGLSSWYPSFYVISSSHIMNDFSIPGVINNPQTWLYSSLVSLPWIIII